MPLGNRLWILNFGIRRSDLKVWDPMEQLVDFWFETFFETFDSKGTRKVL